MIPSKTFHILCAITFVVGIGLIALGLSLEVTP